MLIASLCAWHARRWTVVDDHPVNGVLTITFISEKEALQFIVDMRTHEEAGYSLILPPFKS